MDLKEQLKQYLTLTKKTLGGFSDDHITAQGAALAYYTVFSIAPLILIAVAVSGLVFGEKASQGQIFGSIAGLMGKDGASAVESFVQASSVKSSGIIATIVGVLTLLIGSTTTFAQLQDTLNQIWKVKPKTGETIWHSVRQRLLSFSLILIIGFLLLVSLMTAALLSAVGKYASDHLPGGAFLWQLVNFVLSMGVSFILFAAIYKILPDVKLGWRDVWAGSAITTVLFSIGKFAIGLYLGKSGLSSTYGAAASVMVILVWTYYSALVLLLGAEFTYYVSIDGGRILTLKEGSEWEQKPIQKNELVN